jgi:predicted TIM-barrel fold metal-dependent hydrolase
MSREILDTLLAGEPLTKWRVVDCHGHLGEWKGAGALVGGPDELVAAMDRVGIDVLWINKWNCPDLRRANDDVAAALRRFPDRFVGFAATCLAWGKRNRDELTRCFDELGHRGVKVHSAYEDLPLRDLRGLPAYEEGLAAIREFAGERGCPVLCHGHLTPDVARKYPDAKFLYAHAGGVRSAAHSFADCPNVHFDTASSGTLRGNIEYFVGHGLGDRVLFGTDMPYANPAMRLGQVVGSRLTDEQLAPILGGNADRLLGAP